MDDRSKPTRATVKGDETSPNVLARLEQPENGNRSGRFRVLDRSRRPMPTPHFGLAPLASFATGTSQLAFTSCDRLGLATHRDVHRAIAETLLGLHRGEEPLLASAMRLARTIEAVIGETLGFPRVLLHRSGRSMLGEVLAQLVGSGDQVLVDTSADPRIRDSVRSTGATLVDATYTDPESMFHRLIDLREANPRAGLVVVTQSYFPHDAQSPDLGLLKALCDHHDATLVVDATHDFGCIGPRGGGFLAVQEVLPYVEVVTAELSETFGSDAGFVAVRSDAAYRHLAAALGASASMPPVRAAELLAALELSRSANGDALRTRLARAADTVRRGLAARGFHVVGSAGPVVAVHVGDPDLAVLLHQYLETEGAVAEIVVPPDSGRGARLLFHVTALHTEAQALEAVRALDAAHSIVRWTPSA